MIEPNQPRANFKPEGDGLYKASLKTRLPFRREDRRALPTRLDQKLDQWMSTGKQLVKGVTGARPGNRRDERGGIGRPDLARVGRWVENRLEWLLEDPEDWREPWQEPAAPSLSPDLGTPAVSPVMPDRSPPTGSSKRSTGRLRTPLEAISRRSGPVRRPVSPEPARPPADAQQSADQWPDDDIFTVPRWQRTATPPQPDVPPPPGRTLSQSAPDAPRGGRPLPRSSRRR